MYRISIPVSSKIPLSAVASGNCETGVKTLEQELMITFDWFDEPRLDL